MTRAVDEWWAVELHVEHGAVHVRRVMELLADHWERMKEKRAPDRLVLGLFPDLPHANGYAGDIRRMLKGE